MPPKKQGVHLKDLIGKEVMLLSRYGKETAEGPYTLTGVDVPMISLRRRGGEGDCWFNLEYVVSIKEVVSAAK